VANKKLDKYFGQRDDLAGEHAFGDIGQGTLFLIFLAVWITDSFFFNYSSFPNDHIPLAVQITLGVICLITAGCLSLTGLKIVFVEVREKPHVIRRSVFSIVRHPIYLGEILLYLGLLFFSTSLAAVGVWIITIAFLYYLCRHEEKLLLSKYGQEYEKYMKDVPMLFPRILRKQARLE
jgi:protein-S-isoprenylcysteine O-methyltransferase Ste14